MIEKIENSGNKTPGYRRIRLGTRKSRLAMAQTELAAKALCSAEPGLTVEIVPLTTKGDRILDRPLLGVGGKGAFITEFEDAIQKGEIDAAVHSAKDIPTERYADGDTRGTSDSCIFQERGSAGCAYHGKRPSPIR